MTKLVYRIIILAFLFIASLFYFSKDIKEEVFFTEEKTTPMGEASFPIVYLAIDGAVINELQGYSNQINANMIRESILPITQEQNFTVRIDEQENEVKRVIYEIREFHKNKLVETDTINALDYVEEQKSAKVRIKAELTENIEYAVKITLVTSESKKMNYYTRIKKMSTPYYEEKLDFVMDIHNSLMDKKKAEDIIAYLEPKGDADNSSFSYVNINSSFEMVSYGDLNPKVISRVVPTITDISTDIALVELEYITSCETEYGVENYLTVEHFRVRYTPQRMYLLNYERTMETLFQPDHISLTKNELKLGITRETDIPLEIKSDSSKLAFVRQRELWYYNLLDDKAIKVFSFAETDTDYVRDFYGEHNVRILNMDDDGNISFMVYGYMNRGVYEGKVGIVLYQYYSGDNRIEELVYIPINIPYQMLKEEIDSFSYMNSQKIFYFTLNHSIYSYNLITKGVTVIAEGIYNDNFVFSKEQHYIAYQDSSDPAKSKNIYIMDLETGAIVTIPAERSSLAGEEVSICILGHVDDNIIYGYGYTSDITTGIDGQTLVPMYKIRIVDGNGKILKEYQKEDYYITSILVEDNVIALERMTKVTKDGNPSFALVEGDSILNQRIVVTKSIEINKRITDKMKTEYYISLPSKYKIEKRPVQKTSINTIIHEDTTLRMENTDTLPDKYTVYSFGKVEGMYDNLGDSVKAAYETLGVVVDKEQRVLWERVIRGNTVDISNSLNRVNAGGSKGSLMAAAQMLITHSMGNVTVKDTSLTVSSVHEFLQEYMGDGLLNLTGASMDEILYYVHLRRPVVAMKNSTEAVVIVGYDPYNITVYDPNLSRTTKIGLRDSASMFKGAGNVFFSYVK